MIILTISVIVEDRSLLLVRLDKYALFATAADQKNLFADYIFGAAIKKKLYFGGDVVNKALWHYENNLVRISFF